MSRAGDIIVLCGESFFGDGREGLKAHCEAGVTILRLRARG